MPTCNVVFADTLLQCLVVQTNIKEWVIIYRLCSEVIQEVCGILCLILCPMASWHTLTYFQSSRHLLHIVPVYINGATKSCKKLYTGEKERDWRRLCCVWHAAFVFYSRWSSPLPLLLRWRMTLRVELKSIDEAKSRKKKRGDEGFGRREMTKPPNESTPCTNNEPSRNYHTQTKLWTDNPCSIVGLHVGLQTYVWEDNMYRHYNLCVE